MPLKGQSRFPPVIMNCICEGLGIFLWWDPFCVYLPSPHPYPYPQLSKLTGKTAIRVIFILFSLVGIYLTAENRDRTKIAALGGDWMTGPFALFVRCTRDASAGARCPSLAFSKETCGLPGAGPRGGVQPRGQQGVRLPEKNRFFCARAAHITFSAGLSFFKSVWLEIWPQKHLFFALAGPSSHLYDCAVYIAVFNFFLLLTARLCSPRPLSGHLFLRHGGEVFLPSLCVAGQAEGRSHLQGPGRSVQWACRCFTWPRRKGMSLGRKNLFRNAVQSFVFSHQGDGSVVPASGSAPGRWGTWTGKFHRRVPAHSVVPWTGGHRLVPRVAQECPNLCD